MCRGVANRHEPQQVSDFASKGCAAIYIDICHRASEPFGLLAIAREDLWAYEDSIHEGCDAEEREAVVVFRRKETSNALSNHPNWVVVPKPLIFD